MANEIKIEMKATQEDAERVGRWQIIFKTKAGEDYCRITKDVNDSQVLNKGIEEHARIQCVAFGLGGAVIEAW